MTSIWWLAWAEAGLAAEGNLDRGLGTTHTEEEEENDTTYI